MIEIKCPSGYRELKENELLEIGDLVIKQFKNLAGEKESYEILIIRLGTKYCFGQQEFKFPAEPNARLSESPGPLP